MKETSIGIVPVIIIALCVGFCTKKNSEERAQETTAEIETVKTSTNSTSPTETGKDSLFAAKIDIGMDTHPDSQVQKVDSTWYRLQTQLPPLDLQQDISKKSLSELRILRNLLPARKGYVFMKSDLRAYFENTPWYTPVMESRWYGDCEYSRHVKLPPISYTAEEQAFLDRVTKRETELLARNYIKKDGSTIANYDNVVNGWLFSGFNEAIAGKLRKNCLAIVPNTNIQFFHVYEKNDYAQVQNFVTTDMYLQLFHMHFEFLLRKLEENHFLPVIEELAAGINKVAMQMANHTEQPELKEAAEFIAANFAIPLSLINSKKAEVPLSYRDKYGAELKKIDAQVGDFSSIIPEYKSTYFEYSLFKPRGHYTRTPELEKYFKAMQWLQLSPLCLKEPSELRKVALTALILSRYESASGTPLVALYKRVLEPVTFLIGEPDNVSVMDAVALLKESSIASEKDVFDDAKLAKLEEQLAKIGKIRNKIAPKVETTCHDKINFMPARLVMDNEILQDMAHVEEGVPSKRPFPKGLDIFAALGHKPALDLLLGFHKETENWAGFLPAMSKLQKQFNAFGRWDASVYNKWLQGLMQMLKEEPDYPYFMHLDSWKRKNLNTALASWAELKHDAILYAEQPFAAECGDGGECEPPPDPYTVGYVEPNVKFWQHAIDLLAFTDKVLDRNRLLPKELQHKSEELREITQFLLNASRKELKKEKLTEQEYRSIELIGSTVENLTLSIMETDNWEQVKGPDKEVAVVTDIYTNNLDKKRGGILHVGVGNVNDLYVIVEIEGYLYITKGGTFSYYEFVQPIDKRLTDEAWQNILKSKEVFPVPGWLNEIIAPLGNNPHPKVRTYMYSSGC
ncbi:MAG: DUF3160 domain-containing protein [Chitinispirillaceae bacterium]|nr:DUF3160 domain-containing protein [Chitinispirillaceae bacterium]